MDKNLHFKKCNTVTLSLHTIPKKEMLLTAKDYIKASKKKNEELPVTERRKNFDLQLSLIYL